MQLIKWEPFKEMDRFFDDRFLQPFGAFPKLGLDLAVDVYEEKGNVVAKMSLPGIKSDELDVSIEDDMLTISGRREEEREVDKKDYYSKEIRREEREVDKKDYYSKEIRRGSFSRTVSLPKSVDAGRAEAKYENGELVVTMPVVAGAKEKAVKVKVK